MIPFAELVSGHPQQDFVRYYEHLVDCTYLAQTVGRQYFILDHCDYTVRRRHIDETPGNWLFSSVGVLR